MTTPSALTQEADALVERMGKMIDFFAPEEESARYRAEIARRTILEGGGTRQERMERAVHAVLHPETYWREHPADLSGVEFSSRVTSEGRVRIGGVLHPGVHVLLTVREETLTISFLGDDERPLMVGLGEIPERTLARDEVRGLRRLLNPYGADPVARRILEILGERRHSWPQSGPVLFL